jgi:hypothetical protein
MKKSICQYSLSSISRFESLTLSHNNMIALKPVLLAWLEEAEAARHLATKISNISTVNMRQYRFDNWLYYCMPPIILSVKPAVER